MARRQGIPDGGTSQRLRRRKNVEQEEAELVKVAGRATKGLTKKAKKKKKKKRQKKRTEKTEHQVKIIKRRTR